MFTRRDWLGATILPAAWAQAPALEERFVARSPFEIREVIASTPERTGNWAVKHAQIPDGRLLMAWCSTSGSEVSKTNRIWIAESRDDGRTWLEPRIAVTSRDGESVLNPAIHVHTDGSVLLFHNSGDAKQRFDLILRRSRDGGAAWGEPVTIPFGETVVSSVMSNPIRLRDGAIVLPICYSNPGRRANHYVSTAMISRDGGAKWSRGGEIHVEVERGAMEPAMVELPDGDLYCLVRTKAGFQYESRSRDGGLTWTAARPSPFAGPESTGILLRLRSGAILFAWNGNGYSGGKQVPRYPMTVAMSRDGGKTWPWRKVIETAAGDHQLSNHGLIESGSGRILLAMNHFQGVREGREIGPIVQAAFNEAWITESVAPERWEESPAPTGMIRLEPDGLTLASGGPSEGATRLISRVALPPAGALEVDASGNGSAGIYFGASPAEGNVIPLTGGRQRITIRQPGPWGFHAHHSGSQSRMKIRSVRLMA